MAVTQPVTDSVVKQPRTLGRPECQQHRSPRQPTHGWRWSPAR